MYHTTIAFVSKSWELMELNYSTSIGTVFSYHNSHVYDIEFDFFGVYQEFNKISSIYLYFFGRCLKNIYYIFMGVRKNQNEKRKEKRI